MSFKKEQGRLHRLGGDFEIYGHGTFFSVGQRLKTRAFGILLASTCGPEKTGSSCSPFPLSYQTKRITLPRRCTAAESSLVLADQRAAEQPSNFGGNCLINY